MPAHHLSKDQNLSWYVDIEEGVTYNRKLRAIIWLNYIVRYRSEEIIN